MKKNITTLAITIFFCINAFAANPTAGEITAMSETTIYGTAPANSELDVRVWITGLSQYQSLAYIDVPVTANANGQWSFSYKDKLNDPQGRWEIETYFRNSSQIYILNKTTDKSSHYERKDCMGLFDDLEVPTNNRREIAVDCINEQTFSGTATPNAILVLWNWEYRKNEFGNNQLYSSMRLMNTNSDGTWNWNYRREDISEYFSDYANLELYCLDKKYVVSRQEITSKYCDPTGNPAYVQDIKITGISEQLISGLGGKNTDIFVTGLIYFDDQEYRLSKRISIGEDGTWHWNYRASGVTPFLTNIDSLKFTNSYNEMEFSWEDKYIKAITSENEYHNPFFIKTVDDNLIVGKSKPGTIVEINAIVNNRLISSETATSAGGTWSFNYRNLGLGNYLEAAAAITISCEYSHLDINAEAIEALKNGTYTATQRVVSVGSKFYLSPSVATDKITVQGISGKNVLSIEIYSTAGQRMLQIYDSNTINISGLTSGTYIAKIQEGNIVQNCKFIKK